jgi:hypothetical protein
MSQITCGRCCVGRTGTSYAICGMCTATVQPSPPTCNSRQAMWLWFSRRVCELQGPTQQEGLACCLLSSRGMSACGEALNCSPASFCCQLSCAGHHCCVTVNARCDAVRKSTCMLALVQLHVFLMYEVILYYIRLQRHRATRCAAMHALRSAPSVLCTCTVDHSDVNQQNHMPGV